MAAKFDFPDENPFIRPNLASTGDKEADVLHIAKSKALEAFDEVERGFGYIFAQTIAPAENSQFAALRAYGSTVAGAVRQQMLRESSKVYFRNFKSEEAEKALTRLLSYYQTAGGRRNEFAHGMVGGDMLDGEFWHFLVPNIWTSRSRKIDLSVDYRYSSSQVDEIADKFHWLSGQVFILYDFLEEIYRSSPDKSRLPY